MRQKLFTIASLLLFITTVFAGTPEEKGYSIAREQERRDEGWGDSTVNMKMILRRSNGQETERRLRLKLLEVPDDGEAHT